jgi:hypothetical protein
LGVQLLWLNPHYWDFTSNTWKYIASKKSKIMGISLLVGGIPTPSEK